MRLIRALCGPLFVFAGVMHFLRPDLYRPIRRTRGCGQAMARPPAISVTPLA
ncbi:MAG: hypothetical protein ACKOTA_05825 [Solirubrobacterales bacterium]